MYLSKVYKLISTFLFMKKRGLSHIEAILSFVLFIGFLIFAFFFFSPFGGESRLLGSSMDYAFNEIEDNVTISLESYSVVISSSVGSGIIGVNISTNIPNPEAKVEDSQGNVISSILSEEVVYFEKPGDNFAIVRFSEVFSQGGGSTGDIILTEGENYSISSSDKKDIASEKRFLELGAVYSQSYFALKEHFNLPNRIDFGFILEFDDVSGIVASREIPDDLEVISREKRIEVIREDGEIVFADLRILVW